MNESVDTLHSIMGGPGCWMTSIWTSHFLWIFYIYRQLLFAVAVPPLNHLGVCCRVGSVIHRCPSG